MWWMGFKAYRDSDKNEAGKNGAVEMRRQELSR